MAQTESSESEGEAAKAAAQVKTAKGALAAKTVKTAKSIKPVKLAKAANERRSGAREIAWIASTVASGKARSMSVTSSR
jgi:hypothetical protein